MTEVQRHGFEFENWITQTFFNNYTGNYSQKWDVPEDINKSPLIPNSFQGLPVSIKTAKSKSPIGLGDVLRQRSIHENFIIISGFWKQKTKDEKWIVDIAAIKITHAIWETLWGDLSLERIKELDSIVKDKSIHYTDVRKQAQEFKKSPAFKTSKLVINPKIDSKGQRRVQCSLPYKIFWELANITPNEDNDTLWSQQFKNPIFAKARTFNK